MSGLMIILITHIFSYIATTIFGDFILNSICCWIFGTVDFGGFGEPIARALTWFFMPLFSMLIILPWKRDDREEYRRFKEKLKGHEYSAREDLGKILRSAEIWGEVSFVAVITIVFWASTFLSSWILINIPLFAIMDIFVVWNVHKTWLTWKN